MDGAALRLPWAVESSDTAAVNQHARSFVSGAESGRHRQVDSRPEPEPEPLVDAHYGRLRRLCQLLLGDPEEAHDVVQDVFMKAYEARSQSRTPNDWAPWLTRVTVNACHDRRRAGWWARFRRRTDRIEDVPVAAGGPSPVDRAVGEETRRRIWLAFRALPGRQREVFVLRHVEDLSTDEVARALGLSTGSVKRHLFRAVRRLRDTLGDMA